MEHEELLKKEYSLLNHLTTMPRKILHLREHDNVSEFVLHELCCQDCFNLNKAAYFIDSPDFNCLKGVAGFSRLEAYPTSCSIWESPTAFSVHMSKAPFNQQVRSINQVSMRKSAIADEVIAQQMAHNLGFSDYRFCSWDMKHDNHGILLFEYSGGANEQDKYLLSGLSLLSFCPIF